MSAAAPAQARSSSQPGRLASWGRQALRSFVAAQNIVLDLTAQQNALLLGVLRERIRLPNVRSSSSIADVAERGVTTFTTAGKILLDLAAGESELVVRAVKEGLNLRPATGAMADLVRYRINALIDTQRNVLDLVAEQTHAAVESYNDGQGLNIGTHVGEVARRSILSFVDTEKQFLDLAIEEVNIAVEGGKETRKPAKNRSKVLTQLAREGVDKFIDAQKSLLDLAIEQVDNRPKIDVSEMDEPRTTLAELTQKSMQNFVTAQKSLMDLAVRPIKETAADEEEEEIERPKAHRRPVRKTAAVKTAPRRRSRKSAATVEVKAASDESA